MNPEQEANIHYKRKKVFKNEKGNLLGTGCGTGPELGGLRQQGQ
jgi:hypothetical protein